jgi:undecaprenyl-diphosphatase
MDYLQAADEGTLFWFENHAPPWLTVLMKGFTFLGEREMALALIFAAGLGYFLWKMPRTAAIVLLTALLAHLLTRSVKVLVNRPRPEVAWQRVALPADKSFPSGHALNAMAVFGTIALTFSRRLRRRVGRSVVLGVGFVMPLLIGISRPYLGVHYPSDVIGGWTAGLACAMLALWADVRWGDRRRVVALTDFTEEAHTNPQPHASSEHSFRGPQET